MSESMPPLTSMLAAAPSVLGVALRYAWSGAPAPQLGLSGMVKAAFVKRILELGEAEAKDQAKLTIEQRLATPFAKSVLVRPELLQPADAKYYEGELSQPAVKPAPVPAFFLTPHKAHKTDKIVLYIHGGGYGRGDATGGGISNAFANKLGRPVCSIDYRLGDTAPFPAAVQDAITAYFHLRKSCSSEEIILASDSAGGGLVLATLLH
ncbi:MAG: alpha/beta hydrolase, partial [Oxalobacteraceae bacterium]